MKDLPIVSPHGHTDPQWWASDANFGNAAELLLHPDHYIFRMLYSQGVRLEQLGIPRKDGAPVSTRVYTAAADGRTMTETIIWPGPTAPGLEMTIFRRQD